MEDKNGEIPDIYFDRAAVSVSIFGIALTLSLSDPRPKIGGNGSASPDIGVRHLVVARTGLQHAKLIAMLLRQQLKLFEAKSGVEIKLPSEAYAGLGLNEKDW